MTIDDYWLTFLIATVLPAAVAVVTNRWASGTLKALVLILLSALNGWLTSLLSSGGRFELKAAAVGLFISFITAVTAHYGLTGTNALSITGRDGTIQKALPGGLGGGNPVE